MGLTILGIVTMATVVMVAGQGMSQCQHEFLQSVFDCVRENDMGVSNFLWFVTNQTQENVTADRDTIHDVACSKQMNVRQCVIDRTNEILKANYCLATEQKEDQTPFIKRQFKSLFGALDRQCAHPCRETLTNDLRQCYTESSLDPSLFLSNSLMSRGAVLGTNKTQAYQFCKQKEALLKCMKEVRDSCPEHHVVLRAISLDLDSLEKGIRILCKDVPYYVQGLDCFAQSTHEVFQCNNLQAEQLSWVADQHFSREEAFQYYCQIRVRHVACDMDAWKKKEHTACTSGVLGLRRELECGLLPKHCVELYKDTADTLCNATQFNRHNRPGGAAHSVMPIAILPVLSVVLVVIIHSSICDYLYK